MTKTLILAAFAGPMSTAASAQSAGASMVRFDDVLTEPRNGLEEHAGTLDDMEVQIEDGQTDAARQLDPVNDLIAPGVEAILANAVDISATQAIPDAANAPGVPLVHVNRQPINPRT